MKKISFAILLLIFIAPLLFSGCASQESSENSADNISDQPEPVVKKADTLTISKEIPLDGGYSEISTDSKNVKESFSFLKKELSISYPGISLIQVQKAETQIVAGWKILLFCEYIIGDSKKELHFLTAVIYKDLNNNMTLSNLDFNKYP